MFIRKISRTDRTSSKVYYEYRLVESVRTAEGKVKQRLVLNLGVGFKIPEENWRLLADRIEAIMTGQLEMFSLDNNIEKHAHFYAKKIIKKDATKHVSKPKTSKIETSFETVDVNNMHHHTIRSIGGEHVTLAALRDLKLESKLQELGFIPSQINIVIGQIIGRLLNPGSELSTYGWLSSCSGLDELLDYDFAAIGRDQLYRGSDLLLENKVELENHLSQGARDLFSLVETITLYDLTNTYIEGSGTRNEKAKFGRSKEKRSDCRLVTMGLVLDGEGFPKRSEIFAGNVGEPKTLKEILKNLGAVCAAKNPTVVMDAGIATEDNLQWLRDNSYEYIVVSRKKKQAMPDGERVLVKEKGDDIVTVIQKVNAATNEIELYCHSKRRAEKEQSIKDLRRERFEEGLQTISASLNKKNGIKATEKVIERIGRLKEKYKGTANLYNITHAVNDDGTKVTELCWEKHDETNNAGVYCLRCSRKDLEPKTIWDTYIMLTDIEAAFRSMKSELGMRPIYHQKTERVDGHLFITLLAYHVMHSIRYKLKQKNINASWVTIRNCLNTQIRQTTTMKRQDGKTIHLRKSSVPDIEHRKIYDALDLNYYPGNTLKTIF